MLYTQDLEEIIFQRHQTFNSDEMIVLSGYLGPKPVERLNTLPFNSSVIYGMYGSEGIKSSLHDSLLQIHKNSKSVDVFYSKLPVHSKCYLWRKKGKIIHALIGSANFSINGLRTPFREVLTETTFDTFEPLNKYVQHVLNNSISCEEDVQENKKIKREVLKDYCKTTLLDKNGEVQNVGGLNWGQNPKNHTRKDDAYIAIRTSHIKENPNLFKPKQETPTHFLGKGRKHRHNDSVEIIWDDGLIMEALFEGSQPLNGITYPKQISSFPSKSELGEYIRDRIGVPRGAPVRKHHLIEYGRTDIDISLIGEGIYKFDFSI